MDNKEKKSENNSLQLSDQTINKKRNTLKVNNNNIVFNSSCSSSNKNGWNECKRFLDFHTSK